MPRGTTLPQGFGIGGAGMGERQGGAVKDGLQPTAAGVKRIDAAGCLHLAPPVFGHQQAVQLKRFFAVPQLRHMRGQRADQSARGARTGMRHLQHPHLCALFRRRPSDGQAKDARAMYRHIRRCHFAPPRP